MDPGARGHGDDLGSHLLLLGDERVPPQRPEALAQRQDERVGVARGPCQVDGLGGQGQRRGRVGVVVEGVGVRPRQDRSFRGRHVACGRPGPFQRVDEGEVDVPVRADLPQRGGGERGGSPPHRQVVALGLGDVDGIEQGRLRAQDVVGVQPGLTQLDEHVVAGLAVSGPGKVQQAAGVVPVAGGHLERTPLSGPARRPGRVVERLRSHAGHRTRPAVVHEGGEVLVQIRGAEVLDRGHDRGVQAGPPAGAQLGGQRVGDEGVREPQPRRTGGVLDEQAGVDRRVEGVERVRGRHARDVRQHVELDRDAQHRRAGEQRLGGGRQHADAAADDVEGRARHPGGAGGVHVGEAVLARQQLDDLPDEERVSSGALVDVAGHLGADRAVAAPAEPRADVGVGQAVQVDALGTGLAGQLGEAVDQRRRRVRRDGPDGRQQQHRHRGQGAGHELERPQRRGIGPLEVVDHEEQGPGGRPHRGDHRGVQRGPVGPRVDRVDAAPGGADAVAGRVADDPRSQELLGDLRVPPVRGRRGALLAPCPGDDEPLRRGLGHQLLGQAGLADARLAADDHRPPGAGPRPGGPPRRATRLGRPPDHGHPAPRAVGGPRPTARDDGGGARGARGGARAGASRCGACARMSASSWRSSGPGSTPISSARTPRVSASDRSASVWRPAR